MKKYENWVLYAILSPLMLLLLVLFLGCEEAGYNRARNQNTIAAYESFLQQSPDSDLAQTARNNIESLKFAQAKRVGTTEALEAYLREYPTGKGSEEAKKLIAEAECKRMYQQAESAGTAEALEAYLKDNPKGEWAEKAKKRIDEIASQQASNLDSDIKKNYEKTGQQVASMWLELIDEGKWDEAWKLVSERLKKIDMNDKDRFGDNMKRLRQVGSGTYVMGKNGFFEESGERKLLKVTSRSLQSSQYTAKSGHRPVGNYVIMLYYTECEQAKAQEHVLVAKNSTDQWNIDGYFIEVKR